MFLSFFFPTKQNGYSPIILRKKVMSIFVAGLVLFNFLSNYLFPSVLVNVGAAGYNAQDLVALTNEARVSGGLVPLTYSAALQSAAYAKAQDMLTKDYWAHFGPNGETPWQFIKAAGYIYQYAGENLGRGYDTADSLHNAWMNSPTHKANIMKPEFRDIGIAIVDGHLQGEDTTLVVQMFGALPGASSSSSSASSSVSTQQVQTTAAVTNSQTVTSQVSKTSQATAKSTATATPKLTAPNAPKIISPENGTISNAKTMSLKGTSQNAEKIKIFSGNLEVGNVSPDTDGNWSFEIADLHDGKYSYHAVAINNSNLTSENSNTVEFTIDLLSPVIEVKDFTEVSPSLVTTQQTVNTRFLLTLSITDNIDGVVYKITDDKGIDINFQTFDHISNTVSFPIDLEDNFDIQIVATDKANNVTNFGFTRKELSDKIYNFLKNKIGESAAQNLTGATPVVQKSDVFSIITQNLANLNLDQKVNLIFAFAFLFLAVVDFVILYKKKIPLSRAKSLLHVPILAVIIVYAILSGLGSII